MRDWLIRVAGVALFTLLLERVAARRAARAPLPHDAAGDVVVRAPAFAAALRGAFAVLIGAGAIAILVTPFEGVPYYGRLIGGVWFLVPAVLGVWWSRVLLTQRIVLRRDGVEVQQRRATSLVRWSDVETVDCSNYGPLWKWMTVRTRDRTVRIPLDAAGSGAAYAAALEHVLPERWEDRFAPLERRLKSGQSA